MLKPAVTPSETLGSPRNSGHRIVGVEVIGGFLDGANFNFSSGLNCLIGARGAGKTTVIELIRFALDILPNQDSSQQERRRVETLIQRNLANGRVKVTIETKDGLAYVVSRCVGEEPIVRAADGRPMGVTLKAGGLFRADVYSQNEVESIADRATCQLSLLDNFQPDKIATLNTSIHQIRSNLAANGGQIIPLRKRIATLTEELGTLPGVEDRLKQFSTGTGDDAKAINQAHALKSLRDRERRAVASVQESLQNATREFKGLVGLVNAQAGHIGERDILGGPNGELLKSVAAELNECGREIDRLLGAITDRIGKAASDVDHKGNRLVQAHEEQEIAFRELIEKHQHAQGQAAERGQLERRKNELLAKRATLRQAQEQLDNLIATRDELLYCLTATIDERFGVRQRVADHINEALGPAIRVSISQFGNPEGYVRLLENGLKGSRLKHVVTAQKLAGTFWPTDLVTAIRARNATALMRQAELTGEQAEKVICALFDSPLLYELEIVELLDLPTIELKDGSIHKDSLSLSTGQKCTAILPILLLDSENPLIIDQPEDNLDNRFIFEAVVESIRRVKPKRQLIFSTHNPNIPVLGDAERVFVLDSNGDRSRKASEGTVDEVKPDIVTLLEGGEAAFKARKIRYAY